jgi:acyl-CoA synthetase (AMP-forming)/AMP-acid ligase II
MDMAVTDALRRGPEPALLDGRGTLSHDALLASLETLGAPLAAFGRSDRLAVVAEGSDLALSLLAVMRHAGAAPLNPSYTESEFRFYFDDLGVRALITRADQTRALAAAAQSSIPVFLLQGEAAARSLEPPANQQPLRQSQGSPHPPEEIPALLLHTSGTTGRPKLVGLSHNQLLASARQIGQALALTSQDRSLNIMPLFHIHGLMAGLLAPLLAGGSVFVCERFDALSFFTDLERAQPTYYSAVPTMHQLIVARAARNREVTERAALRLVRSSSAALPPTVLSALEEVFRCPVIESYGMTEAAHQVASNPLPPQVRKPGSVGFPAGPQVRIVQEGGQDVSPEQVGEVVISGPSVIKGYVSPPEANASSFYGSWFRTGDQGYFDGQGYLYLTGRIKELINRGGEKVAPREVEEASLAHEAVAEAVAFAMPHERLGEEVGLAVVLNPGQQLSEAELLAFLRQRLAPFKVPRRILFVSELPKGPSGKVNRLTMARSLGL